MCHRTTLFCQNSVCSCLTYLIICEVVRTATYHASELLFRCVVTCDIVRPYLFEKVYVSVQQNVLFLRSYASQPTTHQRKERLLMRRERTKKKTLEIQCAEKEMVLSIAKLQKQYLATVVIGTRVTPEIFVHLTLLFHRSVRNRAMTTGQIVWLILAPDRLDAFAMRVDFSADTTVDLALVVPPSLIKYLSVFRRSNVCQSASTTDTYDQSCIVSVLQARWRTVPRLDLPANRIESVPDG
jgi:hypothetical protein